VRKLLWGIIQKKEFRQQKGAMLLKVKGDSTFGQKEGGERKKGNKKREREESWQEQTENKKTITSVGVLQFFMHSFC